MYNLYPLRTYQIAMQFLCAIFFLLIQILGPHLVVDVIDCVLCTHKAIKIRMYKRFQCVRALVNSDV